VRFDRGAGGIRHDTPACDGALISCGSPAGPGSGYAEAESKRARWKRWLVDTLCPGHASVSLEH